MAPKKGFRTTMRGVHTPPLTRRRASFPTGNGPLLVADWLAHQAGHHPQLRSAIHPFQRLALTIAPDRALVRRTATKTSFPDLFVVLGESEPIHRQWLQRIEDMVLNQGLDETVMRIAPQFPRLTGILTDSDVYSKFIESKNVPLKWKKPLQSFSRAPNQQLRAIGVLLYLRKAHKTSSRDLNEHMLQLVRRVA